MPNAVPSTSASREKPRRRWFQFSLRMLLAFTAVVACVMGGVSWFQRAEEQRAWVSKIKAPDIHVYYACDLDERGEPTDHPRTPGFSWLPYPDDKDLWSHVERVDFGGTSIDVEQADSQAVAAQMPRRPFLNMSEAQQWDAKFATNMRNRVQT